MKNTIKLVATKVAIWIVRAIVFYLSCVIAYPFGYYVAASVRLHHPMTLQEWKHNLHNHLHYSGKAKV